MVQSFTLPSLASAVLLATSAFWTAKATPNMARPEIYNNATSVEAEARFFYNVNGTIDEVDPGVYANGKISVGYWTNWGTYARNFPPQKIVPSTLTHILYAFADTDASTGVAKLTDLDADQTKHYDGDSWTEPGNNLYGAMKQLYLIKKANRHLKTLLSFGGWTYSQAGHFNFVTNPSARATFVSTAITLLEDNGFDGIDIDYEYPASTAQGQGLASLLTELRTALNQHAAKKGDTTPYLLSVAVGAGPTGYQYLPVATMNTALSFWHLMAYDYAGSWSTVSDDQANVYGGSISGFSTDKALSFYISNGATPSKISLGLPLYGRSFANTAGIRQSYSGIGTGNWEPGIYDYKNLPLAGSSVTEDNTNVASFSYSSGSRELVSYDTPNIIRKKVDYLKSKGLAGSMFWELSGDKVGSESLVSIAASAMGALDTESNHLNYPYSKFDNVRSQMGGGSGTTQPPGTTVTTSTPPGPTGGCSGTSAWTSSGVFVAGNRATYNGNLWEAKWWTQGEAPSTAEWGPWKLIQAC